jgi:3-hydroxyisobutyrate dehydrogenase
MNKDLGLAARLSDSLGVPLPTASAVKQIFQTACNAGLGKEDMSSVYKCYEQWANLN